MYRHFLKRLFDFIAALVLLVITSPVTLLAIIVLIIANKGRVWFIQPRPGLNEKVFNLIKFKTMTDERDAEGTLLPDDVRLTLVGKLIRQTSIDELPQLVNVLKGDMSLIGPRPLLIEYLPLYSAEQRRRHEVRPGITGWAQVNGRNTVSWKDRFALDVWYVDHLSFRLDMKILFLTIIRVLRAEGISGEGTVTMKRFTGND